MNTQLGTATANRADSRLTLETSGPVDVAVRDVWGRDAWERVAEGVGIEPTWPEGHPRLSKPEHYRSASLPLAEGERIERPRRVTAVAGFRDRSLTTRPTFRDAILAAEVNP